MPRIGAVLIKLNQVLTWPRFHREKESFCKTCDPKSRQNSTLRICHDDGNICPVTKV